MSSDHEPTRNVAVLYHGGCFDGFGAAWAARCALGDTAEYLPVLYGTPPPDGLDGREVVILDFAYPRRVLVDLAARAASLLVLDHHQTAEADLRDLPFARFDLKHSGAWLAWRHFRPDRPVPVFVEYLEDRDLWRFKLQASLEVSAWLRSYPFDFDVWNELALSLESDFTNVTREGGAILRMQAQYVRTMADHVRRRWLGGYLVPVANATICVSEVGEELCRRYPDAPFSAYYLDRADGLRQWGLRSRGGFDCSDVAKQFGGGGHPGAAGWVEPALG